MKRELWELELGANLIGKQKASFKVWAPRCSKLDVKIFEDQDPGSKTEKAARLFPLKKDSQGYFSSEIADTFPGDCYRYVLDGQNERPDPVSRHQPYGVHGPSCIVDPFDFRWEDDSWKGLGLEDLIFYELHIGTFTPAGTFEGALEKISYLKKLGITCIEIMPVAQFPGERNWGYDGACLYAVQNSYGGPEAFKKFVNACHRHGLAVCLDVVYNHLGPEGNYLHEYGPYFTSEYQTPWGSAVNYDGPYSDPVRRFFVDNALYWIAEYHVDVLRLDAVHRIYDFSARHILEELNDRVRELAGGLARQVSLIAESDLNDSRILRPKKQGGYGLAGQWSDDFHHAAHAYLTGERKGYYQDFGTLKHLAKSLQEGFVYDGRYSSYRKKRCGNSVKDLPPQQLVGCIQNHDQVGNRVLGDRLSASATFEIQKLAAVLCLLAPHTPLVFMGQEYGETAPFQYFIDHTDTDLLRAVREGRQKESAGFGWKNVPDPKRKMTFLKSKLRWNLIKKRPHQCLLNLYKDLIALRKFLWDQMPGGVFSRKFFNIDFNEEKKWLWLEYSGFSKGSFGILVSFSEREQHITLPLRGRSFEPVLDTENIRYGGKTKRFPRISRRAALMPPQSAVAGRLN